MWRIDRICVWIFLFGLAVLPLTYQYIKFIDELCVLLLGCVAMLDCIVNRNWKKYKVLFILMGIMSFYAIYSGFYLKNNSWEYILMDWVIELKPYVPFAVFIAVAPILTPIEKKMAKNIAIFNGCIVCLLFLGGHSLVTQVLFHVTYGGITLFISSMVIALCSLKDGQISRNDIYLIFFFLTYGLACTRSKYYGIYILSMFFFFFYKPGMMRSFSLKYVLMTMVFLGLIITATWGKFSYYFLTGQGDRFDPTVAQTFARPVLYGTGAMIFMDYFPFGSGLASFASYPSDLGYSNIYYEYGIDKVYGLSPQTRFFICDAFYPSLAQFGVVGIGLFVWFWIYVCTCLKRILRSNSNEYKYPYVIGSLIVLFVLIENIGGNTFTQNAGMIVMCVLGVICGNVTRIKGLSTQSCHKDEDEILRIIARKI